MKKFEICFFSFLKMTTSGLYPILDCFHEAINRHCCKILFVSFFCLKKTKGSTSEDEELIKRSEKLKVWFLQREDKAVVEVPV